MFVQLNPRGLGFKMGLQILFGLYLERTKENCLEKFVIILGGVFHELARQKIVRVKRSSGLEQCPCGARSTPEVCSIGLVLLPTVLCYSVQTWYVLLYWFFDKEDS
jgi:hypothetical protein